MSEGAKVLSYAAIVTIYVVVTILFLRNAREVVMMAVIAVLLMGVVCLLPTRFPERKHDGWPDGS